ncbi:hypothetical protein KP509_34G069800 [Ceratopteris richardii]|uniref:Uncharacterized protein n=1 Tax=Ceratopteris richardii TaxID=49495 RepID=A0A8T2QL52_CERRI|nr:hypothetical protein KP509_34G069800 [Ceratopteris richardii]
MATPLETLCGQAYGAKQYRKMDIYVQRAIFVLNVTAIPLAFICANIERILVVLGQDAAIASKAGQYAVWLIPTLFGNATSQLFNKLLQTQSLVTPLLLISLSVLVCHAPIYWILVFKSGMGFTGVALANSISYRIDVALLALYVRFSPKCAQNRVPLSMEALQDLIPFLKLALPSAAMICLEWCAAASPRVSNELGAGHPHKARGAVYTAATLSVIEVLLGQVYSNEREVIVAVAGLMPLLSLSTSFDGLQAVFSGVARGAVINLGSFYIAGLPVGCILALLLHMGK